jgi:hypothetical protein
MSTATLAPNMPHLLVHVLLFGAVPVLRSHVLFVAEPKSGSVHVACIYSDVR